MITRPRVLSDPTHQLAPAPSPDSSPTLPMSPGSTSPVMTPTLPVLGRRSPQAPRPYTRGIDAERIFTDLFGLQGIDVA